MLSSRVETPHETQKSSSVAIPNIEVMDIKPRLTPVTPASSGKRKQDATAEDASEPEPSAKRSKLSQATKHPRFWALDGNIVIQLDGMRFRLHRSRLAFQSAWFGDLFVRRGGGSLEDEGNLKDIDDVLAVTEEVDGMDVYPLDSTGVAMADFEALLIAMEDGIGYYHSRPTFPTVASIYRASCALEFLQFFAFAKDYLYDMFSSEIYKVTTTPIPHAAEAVVLGRDMDLPSVLKRAFYELLRTPNPTGEPDDDDDDMNPEHPIHDLDSTDLVRLLNAQKRLVTMWNSVTNFDDKCTAESGCILINNPRKYAEIIQSSGVFPKFELDPICGIQLLFNLKWKSTYKCCDKCSSRIKSFLLEKKTDIWDQMDTWFSLD